MKTLKKILIAILAIIILVFVVSLFLPSKVRVERTALINAPVEVVFEQVSDFKMWDKWAVWNMIDTNMQVEYYGPERGVGAGYSWKSEHKNVGSGKLTVTAYSVNDSISTELDFAEQGKSNGGFKFTQEGDATKVYWYMDMDMGMNPIGKFFGLMMDKMLGPDFEKGLANLKNFSENMPAPATAIAEPIVTDSIAATTSEQ